MGKLTPESHGLETPAPPPPHLCAPCRAPGDLLVPPLLLLVLHALAMATHEPGLCGIGDPLVQPTLAWPLYLGAVGLGLGHLLFYPALNPSPGTCAGLFGVLGLGGLALAVVTMPDAGACVPEPGMPWVAYPALGLAGVFFALASNLAAEALARRAQPLGLARALLRLALAPLAPATLVVALCWIDGAPWPPLPQDLIEVGAFGAIAALMLACSPSGRPPPGP